MLVSYGGGREKSLFCIQYSTTKLTMLARLTAARRLPQLVRVRFASDIRSEGSVAQSREFRYDVPFVPSVASNSPYVVFQQEGESS